MPNYACYFEKTARRPLLPQERGIIASLEYIRQHTPHTRIAVIDPPGFDSRPLLIEYLGFLHTHINPLIRVLVMARTRREARNFCARLPKPGRGQLPWYYTGFGACADRVRGINYEIALLLDADGYFNRACAAVSPVVGYTRGLNLLIVHSHTRHIYLPPAYLIDPQGPEPPPQHHYPVQAVYIISNTPDKDSAPATESAPTPRPTTPKPRNPGEFPRQRKR